jgi:predicted metal-dependent HD superfamily phosphohydrolase
MTDTAAAPVPEFAGAALPFCLPAAQQAALLAAYAEPPRAYHHIGHVGEVLRHYARVADGPGWRRPQEVAWAVLYHDAIYRPGRKENERASAELAVAHLKRWLPDAAVDFARVVALIELTARHGGLQRAALIATHAAPDEAEDTLHFLDCDMAILGAPAAQFDAYDRAIAEEYRAVPRWLYRRKRRQFFRHLLQSERIFLSDFFYAAFEDAARANLRRALDTR